MEETINIPTWDQHTHIYKVLIARANSVTWNPHKLMGTLLQCSTLHIKETVSGQTCNWSEEIFN